MSRFADGLDGRALRRLSSVRPTFDLCLLPFDISSRLISTAQREFFEHPDLPPSEPSTTRPDPTYPVFSPVQFVVAQWCRGSMVPRFDVRAVGDAPRVLLF